MTDSDHEWDDPEALAELIEENRRDAELKSASEKATTTLEYELFVADQLRKLIHDLMRPIFVFNMAGGVLEQKLVHGAHGPAAASAETRYRNARREILDLLTEYKENQ